MHKRFRGLTTIIILMAANAFAQSDSSPAEMTKNVSEAQAVSVSHSPRILRGPPISLFDGKTLDGWVKRNGQQSKNWEVVDGTLFRAKGGGDLYHKHWFRDFELSFEWKIDKGGNSGVKYRVQAYGKQMLGCEYQIQDDGEEPFTDQSTGSIYAVVEPSENKLQNPIHQWNHSKIVVCGNEVEHWLNDRLIVKTKIGQLDWLLRVSKSKFGDKEFFGQNREGRVFLQDHGNPVWFRNIVLVPLDSDYCR